MNNTAFDQLEDSKANGYEANLEPETHFYCTKCHLTFEDGDDMSAIDKSFYRLGVTTNVGTCCDCWEV